MHERIIPADTKLYTARGNVSAQVSSENKKYSATFCGLVSSAVTVWPAARIQVNFWSTKKRICYIYVLLHCGPMNKKPSAFVVLL